MIIDLVGYTGFVGSNLCLSHQFDHCFNSKNVTEGYGSEPDILVYSGVTGTKYIANKFPEKDQEIINSAILNINAIAPKKLVLISTIDVYVKPDNVTEDNSPTAEEDFVYGYHRKVLENWVVENIQDYLIVRLPGIYGENLKKNYIYDLMNPIPQVLNVSLYDSLKQKEAIFSDLYAKGDDGFYHLIQDVNIPQIKIQDAFQRVDFSALKFTDSRGIFQYYNLKYLWNHILIALENNIKVLNIATEPFAISELYEYIFGRKMVNECSGSIPYYNYKTKYSNLFNGMNGYIFSKEQVMYDIKQFIEKGR